MKKLALFALLACVPMGAGQYMTKGCAGLMGYLEYQADYQCSQTPGGTCTAGEWDWYYEMAYNQIMPASCFSGQ